MAVDQTRPSYYHATANDPTSYPELAEDLTVDVAVVGAGYTGLSAALELAEAGLSVAVLEAETVGWGASGRNGGQVCPDFINSMERLEKRVGREAAKAAWEIADAAPRLVAERIERYGIDCDFKWGYIHAAERPSQFEELKAHRDQCAELGYTDMTILERDAMREKVGSDLYVGGLWEGGAGHLHPLNYCKGLARAAAAAGARLFENSRAVEIDTGERSGRPSVRTPGGRVDADYLVLAGNAYLGGTVPYLNRRIMPVGSYILATEPLSENRARSLVRDDEAVVNCNFIVDYFRLSADNRMLFGGRATYSGIEPRDLGAFIRPRMQRVFPDLGDAAVDYAWGGNIGITVDRMPHVGRLGSRCYFSQGYSGHGVALSNMCGRLLAEAIRGQAERFDLLARFKHPVFPGGRFRAPLLSLGMLWYRLKDALA